MKDETFGCRNNQARDQNTGCESVNERERPRERTLRRVRARERTFFFKWCRGRERLDQSLIHYARDINSRKHIDPLEYEQKCVSRIFSDRRQSS